MDLFYGVVIVVFGLIMKYCFVMFICRFDSIVFYVYLTCFLLKY